MPSEGAQEITGPTGGGDRVAPPATGVYRAFRPGSPSGTQRAFISRMDATVRLPMKVDRPGRVPVGKHRLATNRLVADKGSRASLCRAELPLHGALARAAMADEVAGMLQRVSKTAVKPLDGGSGRLFVPSTQPAGADACGVCYARLNLASQPSCIMRVYPSKTRNLC